MHPRAVAVAAPPTRRDRLMQAGRYLVKRGLLLLGAYWLGTMCEYLPERFQALCLALAELFRRLPI